MKRFFFEKGYREDQKKIPLVSLHGTWKEMGRQYGALLAPELQDIVSFVEKIENASPANCERAEEIRNILSERMSFQVKSFLRGSAETSGLTLQQMLSAYAVEYIAGLPQCSAMAAWGNYAKNGLVFGRNYDYGTAFRSLGKDVAVTVFHPGDGSLATAVVGYVGEIYAVNGINEKGIFLELNNGTPSTGMPMNPERLTGTSCLFDALFKADSLSWLDRFFETTLCDDSYIINAVDEDEGRSWEWSQSGVRHAESLGPEGLIVSTNYFVHPDWLYPVPDDACCWDGVTRAKHLRELAEKNRGMMDPERMMEILDLGIGEGGATDEMTVYQMVVKPENRMLYLKVPGFSGWVPVSLKIFLEDGLTP